jgi:hypothetical protein
LTALGPASVALISALTAASGGSAYLSDAQIHPPSDYATFKPPAVEGGWYKDPVFGTQVTRLSDSTKLIGSGGKVSRWVSPEYSSITVINADNSLVYVQIGIGLGEKRLYSTNGGLATNVRHPDIYPCGNVLSLQMRWSRTDPHLLYYVEPEAPYYSGPDVPGPSHIKSLNVKTCEIRTLHTFRQYAALYLTTADLSPDGDYMPILANGRYAFWYRLSTDTVGPVIDRVSQLGFGVGVKGGQAMLGAVFTIFSYQSPKFPVSLLVFDAATMTYKFNITEIDHNVFGLDEDGTPIVVMAGSSRTRCAAPLDGPTAYAVIKWNLRTRQETKLGCFPIRPSRTDYYYGLAHKAPGWVLVLHISDKADPDPRDWLPFENEIFLLKLDGSGAVRRLAHHRNRPSVFDPLQTPYWALSKPAISQDGSTVVFGSNMGLVNPTPTRSPDYQDVYAIDVAGGRRLPATGDPARSSP